VRWVTRLVVRRCLGVGVAGRGVVRWCTDLNNRIVNAFPLKTYQRNRQNFMIRRSSVVSVDCDEPLVFKQEHGSFGLRRADAQLPGEPCLGHSGHWLENRVQFRVHNLRVARQGA